MGQHPIKGIPWVFKVAQDIIKIYKDIFTVYNISMKNEEPKLCVNMDCERYPPDWDLKKTPKKIMKMDNNG